jgi:hypothetical protein
MIRQYTTSEKETNYARQSLPLQVVTPLGSTSHEHKWGRSLYDSFDCGLSASTPAPCNERRIGSLFSGTAWQEAFGDGGLRIAYETMPDG